MTHIAASASPTKRSAHGSPRPLRFASFMPSSDISHSLAAIAGYARRIEQAGFTALFVDDDAGPGSFEPLTLAAALAMSTDRIGLVVAAETSFNEPFHVARRLASIDHISGGRAGWNVDTHAITREAGGFFPSKGDVHDERPGQAEEFLSIARELWDSYADDAIIVDKRSGLYFKPGGRRPINYAGSRYRVAGPLNLARSPQAHPVLFYAPASRDEIAFAARHADVMLGPVLSMEAAVAYRAGLDEALIVVGRTRDSVQFWPQINAIAGAPETLADHIAQWSAAGAADGLALRFPLGLADADAVLDRVLPVLSRRGLIATPEGASLREALGLSRPERSAA